MSIITTSDFVGKHELTINTFTTAKLQSYIDRYENEYISKLLGVELKDLYLVDINASPYDSITNPFILQSSCGKIYDSKGIKSMLLGFIYFDYTRDILTSQTITGAVRAQNENSDSPSVFESLSWQRFNEAVITYEAIQWYICENLTDYPTFKGVEQKPINPYF